MSLFAAAYADPAERGQTMAEYAVLIAFLALVGITAFALLGSTVAALFDGLLT